MKREVVFTLAVLSLLAAGLMGADYVSPKVTANTAGFHSVLILPTIVDMSQTGVKGKQGMDKEAEDAEPEFAAGISNALTARGIKVESPFTDEALKGNDQLKYAVADVQKRFGDIVNDLTVKYKSIKYKTGKKESKLQKDIADGRFSLGDSVAVLNSRGTADAIVVSRALGDKVTKAKGFMSGGLIGMAMSGTSFHTLVAVVDAKNGDILFLADYETSGVPKDKTYEKSFRNIPAAQ